MCTGYSWEGIRQIRATLLGARHVPERLCGCYVYLGRYIKCSTFRPTFTFLENKHSQQETQLSLTTEAREGLRGSFNNSFFKYNTVTAGRKTFDYC